MPQHPTPHLTPVCDAPAAATPLCPARATRHEWAAPHAKDGLRHPQHGLWITLWRACVKRRHACEQPLWRTRCFSSTISSENSPDQPLRITQPVEGDVIEVRVEGWAVLRALCTIPGTTPPPSRAQLHRPSSAQKGSGQTADRPGIVAGPGTLTHDPFGTCGSFVVGGERGDRNLAAAEDRAAGPHRGRDRVRLDRRLADPRPRPRAGARRRARRRRTARGCPRCRDLAGRHDRDDRHHHRLDRDDGRHRRRQRRRRRRSRARSAAGEPGRPDRRHRRHQRDAAGLERRLRRRGRAVSRSPWSTS